jgi:CHAT domain-containing protein
MRKLGSALMLLLAAAVAPQAARAAGDFALAPNSAGEACRAVARFDVAEGAKASDIYCGPWERPSGRITLYPSEAAAGDALAQVCPGDATTLQGADFGELKQIACNRKGETGPKRYALVARRGKAVIIGEVYPSDWAPLVAAARVLTGLEKPAAAKTAAGETPGLAQIQSVYPAGPPGQTAAVNYELLRRRAYEYNTIWSFGTAQRDFEELLRTHQQVAPDDVQGEVEILAEIGLNMSSAQRFDAAEAVLARAEAEARSVNDTLLVSKILNYRAIDALNRRRYADALALAKSANTMRAQLAGQAGQGASAITAGDVRRVEGRQVAPTERSLLVSLTDAPAVDRAALLSAQGWYVAGAAARSLGLPEAAADLDLAAAQLERVATPPARLVSDIAIERTELKRTAGDYIGAVTAAGSGLTLIQTAAPQTRAEAHLLMTLEAAQASAGQTKEALDSGRAALAIYAKQTESPGLPPDLAAPHLALLEKEWRSTGDASLAGEYFQTSALVWDGAAARTTAQLAARLVLRQAGDQARGYQDAERGYRAALARRELLAQDKDATPDQVAVADTAVRDASGRLAAAEAQLRERAPAYLELLNPQASAADLQQVLTDQEAYLRIVVTDQGVFGLVADRSGVYPYRAPLTTAQVDALADRLRRSTHLHGHRLPDFDIESSQALYAGLIAPVKDRLTNIKRLDLDVSGSLASVPFAALIEQAPTQDQMQRISESQDYTGVAWLGRRLAISNTLGPASFIRLRKTAAPPAQALKAVAYGDYVPNAEEAALRLAKAHGLSDACRAQVERTLVAMGPLPDTADEARGVAARFPGSRLALENAFTDADFMKSDDAGAADVLMFATHGVLGLSSCLAEPALLTSVGDSGTGLIEASQLFDRQINARIVVLSACDTAAGGKLDEAETGLADGGDALSGLARGFIYAGARDVLVTQWKVDSAATSAEMSAFFDAATGKGAGLDESLAAAQKKLFDVPETAHPFYWAAFILVGDGGGSLAAPAGPSS